MRTDKHGFGGADGFAVNEKEHIIYVLEFKRVSDTGQEYVAETQQLASASIWHDLHLKFSIRKEDRVKVIKNLGRTWLVHDELENLFRSYWDHQLGVFRMDCSKY
jgi:hypothetical protein